MKVVFYFLTVILGAYGVLALLRFAELLLVAGQPTPMQLLVGIAAVSLAWLSLKKARETR